MENHLNEEIKKAMDYDLKSQVLSANSQNMMLIPSWAVCAVVIDRYQRIAYLICPPLVLGRNKILRAYGRTGINGEKIKN